MHKHSSDGVGIIDLHIHVLSSTIQTFREFNMLV